MKSILLGALLVSSSAFAADTGSMGAKTMGAKAMDMGKKMAEACKSEQVQYCKTMTEMAPLKECLMKNKAHLSEPCKKSVGI